MSEILFLAHRIPFPPNRGDKIRSHHLLRKLASLAPVHVGCFSETVEDRASVSELAAVSASHCVVQRSKPLVLAGAEAVLTGKPVSLTAFHSAKFESWVRKTLAERPISAIVVFSGQMGQYIPEDYAGRVIIDLCDVDSAKFEGYAEAGERVWLNAREARLLAAEEERLSHRCDATVLITQSEADLFRSRLKAPQKAHIEVIGNGIDAAFFDPAAVDPHPELAARPGPHFVFTGQMDYKPNEQAALWAIGAFWAAYKVDHPAAELHIVGRNPTRLLQQQAGEGVRIWGEVPDVRPFIKAADCVVAPLMIARGVQNKVLEAMAMARPVMLTPQAATGINARDGEHWLIEAAESEAMSERMASLLKDADEVQRIGAAAREFVLSHHAWDAMLAPLSELIRSDGEEEARNAA